MAENNTFSKKWLMPIAIATIAGLIVVVIQKSCIDLNEATDIANNVTQTSNNYYGSEKTPPESPVQITKEVSKRLPSPSHPIINQGNERGNVVEVDDVIDFVNDISAKEVMVLIVEGGNISSELSSLIATVYNDSGKEAGVGLFKNNFIKNEKFERIRSGDINVLNKLQVANYAKKIVIGLLESNIKEGSLVKGTYVCDLTMHVDVISVNGEVSRFDIHVKGNDVTQSAAKRKAIKELTYEYSENYLAL